MAFLKLCFVTLLYILFMTEKTKDKLQPQTKTACVGSAVSLKCQSDAAVSWMFNKGELPENTLSGAYKGGTTHWLKLYSIQKGNAGKYTCWGLEDNHFYFTDTMTLEVIGK